MSLLNIIMDNDNKDNDEETRINKCNLELLVNPLYQKSIVKTDKNEVKNSKSDLKFYRKRILSLTNDYLKGNYNQYGKPNEALKQLHDEYFYNVIQYLKMVDKVDIIQQEHIVSNTDVSCANIISPPDNFMVNCEEPLMHVENIESYNSQLILKKQVSTLDSYIKRTKRVIKSPMKMPVNKVIDYHLPELKNKGVKENSAKENTAKEKNNINKL